MGGIVVGPGNSPPVQLFFVNEKTGEKTELTATIKEFSVTETGDDKPMYFSGCGDCSHADHKRKQGEKVRCTRWSRWVSPQGKPCEEHSISFPLNLTPEQYLASLEMMKNYQRKHGGNFV